MPHREGIRAYLEEVEVYGLVHDWGCGSKPIKKYLVKNSANFVGIDNNIDVNPEIVADVEKPLELRDKADFAFCLEVIEHTWQPGIVLKNIYDNLKSGGYFYLSQPFMFQVHKEDDRIRFTYNGLRQILEEVGFKVEDLQPTEGDLDHASGYILRARK